MDVMEGDLDALRREMAKRTMALLDLGYQAMTPEEVLQGVNIDQFQVIPFSEPWQFKMDVEDQG